MRAPPPPPGTFNRRLKFAALLSAVFGASLLLIACPSPGGGGTGTAGGGEGTTTPGGGGGTGTTTPPTYTTTVTGTITASAPGETSIIDLPGAAVSALTTPANSANQPAASGPDGAFTLQVKHSGSFRIKVDNTCSDSLTTDAVTASADGAHNAGTLQLTLKPEPAGTARYSITPRTAGGFKLTVKECVREIRNAEFGSSSGIITAKAAAEGVEAPRLITEISLPSTLTKIDTAGLASHSRVSEPLRIPRNVKTIGPRALSTLGFNASGVTLVFEAGSKLESIGFRAFQLSRLKDFRLPENLETIARSAFIDAAFSFSDGFSPAGTLTIPAKVSEIGSRAFEGITGITTVDILSRQLAKPPGAAPGTPPADYPLQPRIFENPSADLTEIKLPSEVYTSYTPAERTAIFGAVSLTQVP